MDVEYFNGNDITGTYRRRESENVPVELSVNSFDPLGWGMRKWLRFSVSYYS
jgi:hypothetical protein